MMEMCAVCICQTANSTNQSLEVVPFSTLYLEQIIFDELT